MAIRVPSQLDGASGSTVVVLWQRHRVAILEPDVRKGTRAERESYTCCPFVRNPASLNRVFLWPRGGRVRNHPGLTFTFPLRNQRARRFVVVYRPMTENSNSSRSSDSGD